MTSRDGIEAFAATAGFRHAQLTIIDVPEGPAPHLHSQAASEVEVGSSGVSTSRTRNGDSPLSSSRNWTREGRMLRVPPVASRLAHDSHISHARSPSRLHDFVLPWDRDNGGMWCSARSIERGGAMLRTGL